MKTKKIEKDITPILEEYTKRNNIEYDFFLTTEYYINIDLTPYSIIEVDGDLFVKIERAFISMVDRNNNILRFEEINSDIFYKKDIIPIVTRLVREQRLKELGI